MQSSLVQAATSATLSLLALEPPICERGESDFYMIILKKVQISITQSKSEKSVSKKYCFFNLLSKFNNKKNIFIT